MAFEISTKKILVWLTVAFVIFSLWEDPRGTGQNMGPFLGELGHFLMQFFSKMAAFLSAL